MKKPAINLLYFLATTMDLILTRFKQSEKKEWNEIRKEFSVVASKTRKISNDLGVTFSKKEKENFYLGSSLFLRMIDVIIAANNKNRLKEIIDFIEEKENEFEIPKTK